MIIDLTDAHIWDSSAVAVSDTVVAEITGLNQHSTEIHDRLSGHLAAGH